MRMNRTRIVISLALLIGCSGVYPKRTPYRYLIPNGYVGWVEVIFGVVDEPELPVVEGFRIVKFPKEGVLKTSSSLEDGWAKDEYYYYDGKTKRRLSDGYKTGMINAGSTGLRGISGRQSQWFFVGTYDQYMKYGYKNTTAPNIGPVTQ